MNDKSIQSNVSSCIGLLIKIVVLYLATLTISTSGWAKSYQELADAMLERTEHQQLAANFNLNGGYRVQKGVSVWIDPIYTGDELYRHDGEQKTVTQWYVLADSQWYMAHQLYASGLYQDALKMAEKAKDIYDALNNNVGQTIGFWKVNQITQVNYPVDGWATIAYEDLFPNEGDADYNDLVVNMRITEVYNRNDQLISINMHFVPRARGASYNHEFTMVMDGEVDGPSNISLLTQPVFSGVGFATVRRHNATGMEISQDTYTDGADLIVFPDTRTALPAAPGSFAANTVPGTCMTTPQVTTRVDIMITDPAANLLSDRIQVGVPNYRPVLRVKTTGQDIDVVDINSDVISGGDGGMTVDGYPFGIVVPMNWAWPMEYQHIEWAYPLFADYRQSLLNGVPSTNPDVVEWFNHPAADAATYVFDPSKFTGVCP